MLYGIAVMILSLVLMNRRWTKPLLDDDLDADSYAIWLTAMVAMYGVGYPVGHTAVIGWCRGRAEIVFSEKSLFRSSPPPRNIRVVAASPPRPASAE